MIPHRLSELADRAAGRYGAVTLLWQGLFERALSSPEFGRPSLATAVVAEAYQIAEDYLITERKEIEALTQEIALEAHRSTLAEIAVNDASELPQLALEHLSASESYLMNELVAQLQRDVATMRQALQRTVLGVRTLQRAKGIPERQALLEYRLSNPDALEFTFHDRRAAKWASRKFIRTVWRHTLLAVYNETVMLTLADYGFDRAAILQENAGSMNKVAALSLTGEEGLLSYGVARQRFFHPNANSILALESAHV